MTSRSPSPRRTSTWLVAPLLAAASLVACARSNFDPDEGPGGTAGAAGTTTAGTGGTTSGTGGTASGAAGSTAGTGGTGGSAAGTGGSTAGTGGTGGGSGKGGSSGKGGTGGSGGTGGGTSGGCRLVINEICAQACSGSDKANDELIELFNGGDAACDVDGWTVKYRSDKNSADIDVWAGKSGESIAPGGFYVIGGPDFSGSSDFSYMDGKLSKDGGGVGLKNDKGVVQDSVAYGTADSSHEYAEGTPAAKFSIGSSIGRTNDGKDTDDNAADFTEGSPSPGNAN